MTRARYACDPQTSRGRLTPQPPSAWRSEFQRDRDRIIHASAFRRLKHKTQVFVSPEGDHFRTRLTHSLEVAQIARSMARALQLDEDLTEALALAHDLGHTAFGHAGEDALNSRMLPYGGFDHNAQALRIVTQLEQRHIGFDGLNLTWETLEGLVKHNGPLVTPASPASGLAWGIAGYNARQDLHLSSFASLEAQVAAVADDIAYNAHDLDDGLRAGLFTLEAARSVPMVDDAAADILARNAGVSPTRLVPEIVREMIGAMIGDVLQHTSAQIAALAPQSADDVRAAGSALVGFSPGMALREHQIKLFLRDKMYHHPKLLQRIALAERVIFDLFDVFMAKPDLLPDDWQARASAGGTSEQARCIADFIAGMTDRYAIKLFNVHFGPVLGDLLNDGLMI